MKLTLKSCSYAEVDTEKNVFIVVSLEQCLLHAWCYLLVVFFVCESSRVSDLCVQEPHCSALQLTRTSLMM